MVAFEDKKGHHIGLHFLFAQKRTLKIQLKWMSNHFQMQLRNMTMHYNELNDIHNDLFMLATETLDIKLENFTNQINKYHEERSLRLKVVTI